MLRRLHGALERVNLRETLREGGVARGLAGVGVGNDFLLRSESGGELRGGFARVEIRVDEQRGGGERDGEEEERRVALERGEDGAE